MRSVIGAGLAWRGARFLRLQVPGSAGNCLAAADRIERSEGILLSALLALAIRGVKRANCHMDAAGSSDGRKR
jgi:hypothetical protein